MPPVTLTDEVMTSAAKTLTPDKSLDRAEAHAKYLFSTVTIFGTLLTGFGVLSGSAVITHQPWLLIAPLSFICLSLALSMYVLTPSRGRVNLDNLADVETYFGDRIRRRGRAIFAAGILFAIALISVIPIVAFANRNVMKSSLTAKATRATDTDNIAATFNYAGLPAGVVAKITARATRTDGVVIPVFEEVSAVRDGGDLSGEISVPEANVIKQLVINATATRGAVTIHTDQIQLTLAPRPAPVQGSKVPLAKPKLRKKKRARK